MRYQEAVQLIRDQQDTIMQLIGKYAR